MTTAVIQFSPLKYLYINENFELKGTVQRDFRASIFLSHDLNLPVPLTNGLNIFDSG